MVAGAEPAEQRRRVVGAGPALAGVGGEEVHQHQRLGRGVHGLRFGPAGAPAINQARAAVCPSKSNIIIFIYFVLSLYVTRNKTKQNKTKQKTL